MQLLESSQNVKLLREEDGTIWLHIGKTLSINLNELALSKGPLWLYTFKQWSKTLKGAL